MKNSLEVEGLKKYYGNLKAVDGISFSVEDGSVFGMLGPNGAGKTTTIETLIGLKEKDGGKVSILGYDPFLEKDLKEIKKKIGVQLQSPSLFPRLTVKEIVNLFASFYPDPLENDLVIEQVGLENKKNERVISLSGGQKHRLAVALAMISNGDLIFLDEPTTGLDPQARRQLWDVIQGLKEKGVTVFLTTHYMEEAEKLCDNLVIIDQGEIIAKGSPKKLINEYFEEKAVEFNDPGFSNEEIRDLKENLDVDRIGYEEKLNRFILYSKDIKKLMTNLINYSKSTKKEIDDITIRQASLEDVFIKLTGRGIRE
ncbi:MAG TPA: ABC transporter ATP-binding protein [Halanaerobiales bacterium]|nr:ABC transporter ATP-binding protein [Halanaerobiales bacterium]